MQTILRKNKRGITKALGNEKRVFKVTFVAFNETEEEERRKRGAALRSRIRSQKEYQRLLKNMAQVTPQRVWAALVNPALVLNLSALAQNSAGFHRELSALFALVAAVPNTNINPNQPNVLGVLNAMVASGVTFLTLSVSAGGIDIVECLHMIGSIPRFGPFLAPPPVSEGSDHGG